MTDIERQLKLEADAVQDGLLRFAESRKYHLITDSKPVRDLLRDLLKPLADAILAEQIEVMSPERQKLTKYAVALSSINHEKLALITIGTILNAITRSEFSEGSAPGLTSVAYEIGQRCRLERIYDCARNRQIDVADALIGRNRSRHAGRRAAELARKVDDEDDWAKNYRSFHLGERLIALAVLHVLFEGKPMFEVNTFHESEALHKRTTIALATPASEWIATQESLLAALASPVYLPMIVQPRPWTSLSEGGYLVTPLKLLKRQATKRVEQQLAKANLLPVFSAATALQNTAFRFNRDITRDIRTGWSADLPIFGLTRHTLAPLPPRLPDDASPDEIKERKRERADAFKLNDLIKGRKKVMALSLCLTERLIDEPRIYFPHQLDYRGRAYPVPQMINPQADHIGRAPLEFADGKPLGERGPLWLQVQIANCYLKGTKLTIAKREAWVQQNEAEIIAFAADPHRTPLHRFWKEADKQWLFLAGCQEWKRYKEQGPGFLSHLPVSMDGTCNGYQHLSAMGRDPIGGRATNLIPSSEPQDIYQENADHVSRRIWNDAAVPGPDQDAAQQLFGLIDRNVVKHATMTTPYGVTRGTIYKHLLDEGPARFCRDPKKCARYLAKVLEETIPLVAVGAGKIMKWLREVARILAKANRGMAWTTPAGLLVVHEAWEPKAVRLTTFGRTLTVYDENATRKIDLRKQVDGIVAHFVHSMDAAHMMLTINRLVAEGVHHFLMVHDSFGVHACDVDILNRVLREEFVRIYSEPVLQNFLNEQREANPDIELPDAPQLGNLDIRQVLDSPYFFA